MANRTKKGNVTAEARKQHGESDGSFPIFDKTSAESALHLRGHASTRKERSQIISRAAKYVPGKAQAAREADKAAGKLTEPFLEVQDLAGTAAGQLPNCPSWPSPDLIPQSTMAKNSVTPPSKGKPGSADVMKEHPHQKATNKSTVKMADPEMTKGKKGKKGKKGQEPCDSQEEMSTKKCSSNFNGTVEVYSEQFLGSEIVEY